MAGRVRFPAVTPSEPMDADALDQSIRLFQNILQALLLARIDPSEAARIQSPAAQEWFARLAPISGVASAIGSGTIPSPSAQHATLRFDPCPEGLRELYLLHRSIRSERRRGDAAAARAAAHLAVLAGIAADVRRRGLWPAYIHAARQARATLQSGVEAFPPGAETP